MPNDTKRKFLIFESHDHPYAFDLAHVAEVSEPLPSWPIPLAPACCRGAVHIRGSIVATMDLASFMGFPQCIQPEKLIVLHKEIAALAFLVGRVIKIVDEHELNLVESPEEGLTDYKLILPEGDIPLLNVYKVVKIAEDFMTSPS